MPGRLYATRTVDKERVMASRFMQKQPEIVVGTASDSLNLRSRA